MSIKTTTTISKERAIERITYIVKLIEDAEWSVLYEVVEDDSYFKDNFVNEYNDLYKEYINNNSLFVTLDKWPNKYLEEFMDKTGIAYTQFENYIVE